jgi:hypothetical protein
MGKIMHVVTQLAYAFGGGKSKPNGREIDLRSTQSTKTRLFLPLC